MTPFLRNDFSKIRRTDDLDDGMILWSVHTLVCTETWHVSVNLFFFCQPASQALVLLVNRSKRGDPFTVRLNMCGDLN